mmetsp:Transcript_12195/g.11759  ORF Transcript_12195/g.11759 Transcript_12195/m.11759 type:complete len:85 (-) Transcript_12195:185-439(-)
MRKVRQHHRRRKKHRSQRKSHQKRKEGNQKIKGNNANNIIKHGLILIRSEFVTLEVSQQNVVFKKIDTGRSFTIKIILITWKCK